MIHSKRILQKREKQVNMYIVVKIFGFNLIKKVIIQLLKIISLKNIYYWVGDQCYVEAGQLI